MAWWLQGDLQPFAHFRSGMGRSPGGSVGAAAAAAGRESRLEGAGLRPYLAPCRGWVRGREQSRARGKRTACVGATRRQKAVDEGILGAYNEYNKMGK